MKQINEATNCSGEKFGRQPIVHSVHLVTQILVQKIKSELFVQDQTKTSFGCVKFTHCQCNIVLANLSASLCNSGSIDR